MNDGHYQILLVRDEERRTSMVVMTRSEMTITCCDTSAQPQVLSGLFLIATNFSIRRIIAVFLCL